VSKNWEEVGRGEQKNKGKRGRGGKDSFLLPPTSPTAPFLFALDCSF